jgi:hypothetical protein
MSDQHKGTQTQAADGAPPTKAPPRWQWALLTAIPTGLIGTYVLSFIGNHFLVYLGLIPEYDAWTLFAIVVLVTFGGLLPAAVGAIIGAVAAWPLGKWAARRWRFVGVLLAGFLAGIIGGLMIALVFVWFMLL